MKDKSLKNVEEYGNLYIKRFLTRQVGNKSRILSDRRYSISFCLSKFFYRGRRDSISQAFEAVALAEIAKLKNFDNWGTGSYDKKLHLAGLNNHMDRKMVSGLLAYQAEVWRHNGLTITEYMVNNIKSGKAEQMSSELKSIYAIGDKLSSFYLRDLAFVYNLEKYIKPDGLGLFYPVDVWVARVGADLEIYPQKTALNKVRSLVIPVCVSSGVSPLKLNAGMWYIGARAYELLIAMAKQTPVQRT